MSVAIADFHDQPQAPRHLTLVPQSTPAAGVDAAQMHITRRGLT